MRNIMLLSAAVVALSAPAKALPISQINVNPVVDEVRYVCTWNTFTHRRHCYWVSDHRHGRWRDGYRY